MQIMRRKDMWSPFRELEEFSNRLGRFFDAARWPDEAEQEAMAMTDWWPSCNVSETDKEYRIRAELPNVKKDDVHVTFENGILTIEGQRREEKEEKGTKFHRRELAYGRFIRRFRLPGDADEAKTEATYKDGVLDVAIGKAEGKADRSRHIEVR